MTLTTLIILTVMLAALGAVLALRGGIGKSRSTTALFVLSNVSIAGSLLVASIWATALLIPEPVMRDYQDRETEGQFYGYYNPSWGSNRSSSVGQYVFREVSPSNNALPTLESVAFYLFITSVILCAGGQYLCVRTILRKESGQKTGG
ncbi:hypothetical protein [Pontiella agarivorans]|uniref:Uncharacterized protein n=1 Tax=Pontiella agarivorans TaxID=3038953 RepID=A0ABU5MYH2_9BACT|nr:hypothetical protein [Pontiella agarivorans]MDZ8119219.1 hypothetical protein [Pontiella agarivorans]